MELKILENRELDVAMMEACRQWLPASSRGACRIIAKTQAKLTFDQIIEWLEKHSYKQFKTDADLHLNSTDWQHLKELIVNDRYGSE